MPKYVRLRGPQLTLQRRKRDCPLDPCPNYRKTNLLPSLLFMYLSIAFASIGLLILTEVKIVQWSQMDKRLMKKIQHSTVDRPFPTMFRSRGDFFKIAPLLSNATPSVELSAQITLNKLYSINNKNDIEKYRGWIHCREENGGDCAEFSLVDKSFRRTNWSSLIPCSLYPSELVGLSKISAYQHLKLNQIEQKTLARIRPGGWWEPRECLPRHSVAIVIPYKDRWRHLTTLLNHLHPLLQKQQLRYKVFVVEQYGNETFNKGRIMNAAFLEALKEELFHCFIFHDVDLIPENDYNMYSCPNMPRHLSIAVNEMNYRLPYSILVGGVFAIRTDHFFTVNGYSNFYWGWGGEDDDMGMRVWQSGLQIIRPLPILGRYTMIKHPKRTPANNQILRRLLRTSRKRYRLEGLNSAQYKLISKKAYPWFTRFLVDVGKPHSSFYSKSNR